MTFIVGGAGEPQGLVAWLVVLIQHEPKVGVLVDAVADSFVPRLTFRGGLDDGQYDFGRS